LARPLQPQMLLRLRMLLRRPLLANALCPLSDVVVLSACAAIVAAR
jgi:hypothetical protein